MLLMQLVCVCKQSACQLGQIGDITRGWNALVTQMGDSPAQVILMPHDRCCEHVLHPRL